MSKKGRTSRASLRLFCWYKVGGEGALPFEEEESADCHGDEPKRLAGHEWESDSLYICSQRSIAYEADTKGSHEHCRNHSDEVGLAIASQVDAACP